MAEAAKAEREIETPGNPQFQASEIFYFFLCLFFRRRFLRLCVAILCLFLFLPLGIGLIYFLIR